MATSAAWALMVGIAVVSTVAAYRNGRLADQLKAQRDEANRNLIHAYTNEAEARRNGRRGVGQRFEALNAIDLAMQLARATGLTETDRGRLRNQAIAAMGLPDLRVSKEIAIDDPNKFGFAVNASFEHARSSATTARRRRAPSRR